jgi:hypothetical protein
VKNGVFLFYKLRLFQNFSFWNSNLRLSMEEMVMRYTANGEI